MSAHEEEIIDLDPNADTPATEVEQDHALEVTAEEEELGSVLYQEIDDEDDFSNGVDE